MLDVDQ